MVSTLRQVEEQFTAAIDNWSLEKLYIDLASAKGKGLTPVEKKILRGLLCGYSPSEIANAVYQSRSSSAVRVYLSNGLYKYIESMLSLTGNGIKITHWSRVTALLEKAGYKNASAYQFQLNNILTEEKFHQISSLAATDRRFDWGEAIDVSCFYGREEELDRLARWIATERCRLVGIIGMGGIGKTSTSVKLAQKVQDKFEYGIWRSISHAAPIYEFLAELIQFLSHQAEIQADVPKTLAGRVSRLIELLRTSRCLIVLDGIESILQAGALTGHYQSGYEGYGELFRRVGEVNHQSCLVLTSREKLKEISSLEGITLPVRCLQLTELKQVDCQEILKAKGLYGSSNDWKKLIGNYAGNPLLLKIVSATIKDVFDGNINDFIKQDVLILNGIKKVLELHFIRLSEVEKKLLYWLVAHRELVLLPELPEEIISGVSKAELIEALESLKWRSLVDKHSTIFKPNPLFVKYITEQKKPSLVSQSAEVLYS